MFFTRFFFILTLFSLIVGCSKNDGFIKSFNNPLPVINAIAFSNRELIVYMKTVAPLEDGGNQSEIKDAHLYLYKNQLIFDTLKSDGNGRYSSNRFLEPGFHYKLKGNIGEQEFYSTEEYMAFPPTIVSLQRIDTTFSDRLYKVCVESLDDKVKYYLNSNSYRLYEDTSVIRHSFYPDYSNRIEAGAEMKCYFIEAYKGITYYFGVVTQSWIDFLLSNKDLEGSQNSFNLYNLPVKSNLKGAYGIFGLYSCDSIKIIQ